MATLEERFDWLKDVLEEKPQSFADYYKEDISNYLDIDSLESDELGTVLKNKFKNFIACKNKEDMRKFVDGITSYIVMKAQIEEIVADYFS